MILEKFHKFLYNSLLMSVLVETVFVYWHWMQFSQLDMKEVSIYKEKHRELSNLINTSYELSYHFDISC